MQSSQFMSLQLILSQFNLARKLLTSKCLAIIVSNVKTQVDEKNKNSFFFKINDRRNNTKEDQNRNIYRT